MEEKISVFSLSFSQLENLLRAAGSTDISREKIQSHVDNGFTLNPDGTIDLFDYAIFLAGKKLDSPPPRMPPKKSFDMKNVKYSELAGWLTLYNHIGYELTKGRMAEIFRTYKSRIQSSVNPSNIDFISFVAFCESNYSTMPGRRKSVSKSSYEEHKAAMALRSRLASSAARDIGELPEIENPERRKDCRYDFGRFCLEYFPHQFSLEWSPDHLKCIRKIEECVMHGGLFAYAMPRGSGKTTLAEAAGIWSVIYGHLEYVCLVGATETAADEILSSIKTEFETNDMLLADFPEVCFPIRAMDGITKRCMGQTYHGERTRIEWTATQIVLPTVKGSCASGSIVQVAGITGRIRGMKFKKADGVTIRPQLVIIDDPQTRESAGSLEQNRKRLATVNGDILGLAGPGKKIAAVMPCTVIENGDMVDQLLDKEQNPDWNGERAKLLYQFPAHMELWDEYDMIRKESLREYGNADKATEFYADNREKMDDGAVVGWEQRFNHDEISAVQNAMNLFYRDRMSFCAEFQNEPVSAKENDVDSMLSADAIASKLNRLDRFAVPLNATRITMFVDVQKTLLYYAVVAYSDDFTCAVIDYGTYPEQKRTRFTLATAQPTMHDAFPHASIEGYITQSLSKLFDRMFGMTFIREDGMEMKIDHAAIDASWGDTTETIYEFARRSQWSASILPSHGHYIGASSKPMSEYRKQRGDRCGLNWRIPSVKGKRASKHIIYDTNYWKTFVHERLSAEIGDRGGMTLFGKNQLAHEMIAEHLTAEFRVKTEGRGRTVYEWKLKPDKPDNHWFDCIVGCTMLASMLGSSLPEHSSMVQKTRKIRVSDMDRKRNQHIVNDELKGEYKNEPVKKKLVLSEIARRK